MRVQEAAAWLVKHGMNPGWVETAQAILIALGVALVIGVVLWLGFALTGCAGTSVAPDFKHRSSAQDYRDRCEDNLLGFDMRFPLVIGNCGEHCAELELGLGWDVNGGACQGRDPIGDARIRVPVWVKH